MRAMKAEGFSGYKDLKLVDIPKPAVSDGRVLVRITAAGVTPLEHTILSGGYPRAKAPLVLGGEGAGVVEEGGGTAFPAGSRVMFTGPYGVSEIVEEQALISALKNKQIAGAAIDVFDMEPLPPSHPFRTLDNVLATPHLGYVSHGLYKTFYEDTVLNIRSWLDTKREDGSM
jgi:hypothetical protein